MAAGSRQSNMRAELRIRLVWADGTAWDISEAMTAAEVLICSENDKQLADGSTACIGQTKTPVRGAAPSDTNSGNWLVCDSASLRVGKRACPMHPEAQLERGHLYFVLPMVAFQHRLPWSYIACLAAMAAAAAAAGGAAATPTSAAASFALVPPLKSYLTFLLSGPRHRCRAFLAKLAHRRRVNDTHVAADHRRAYPAAGGSLSVSQHSIRSCGLRPLRNVCHSPEAHCKYVEQLIDRSQSWKPPLLTIHE